MKYILFAPTFAMIFSFAQNPSTLNGNEIVLNYISPSPEYKPIKTDKNKRNKGISNERSKVVNDFISSQKNLVKIPVTGVPVKAFKDFLRLHKNVDNAQWFKTNVGFVATFITNEKDTKVVYDNYGRWFYNLSSYKQDRLDFATRHIVKSRYYDNNILFVYQYDFEYKTVYIIRMSDKNSNIMTIKVSEGVIEEMPG